jgi:cytochrome c556
MNKFVKSAVTGFALIAVVGTTFAQMKPEDQIKARQAGYRFMAWNMGKIKANIDGQYNKDQVIAAANVVAAVANSGMGALFGPGTDKGTGFHETHVKPEFFKEGDKVKEVAMAYIKEANELAKVAATGDAAAVKAQFGKTGEACKACHEKFRKED